jgi:hypothetical protein
MCCSILLFTVVYVVCGGGGTTSLHSSLESLLHDNSKLEMNYAATKRGEEEEGSRSYHNF